MHFDLTLYKLAFYISLKKRFNHIIRVHIYDDFSIWDWVSIHTVGLRENKSNQKEMNSFYRNETNVLLEWRNMGYGKKVL